MPQKPHLLITGSGPWPSESNAPVTGPAIRTRQFAEPLIEAGHRVSVLLFENAMREPRIGGVVQAVALPPGEMENPEIVERFLDISTVDAVIGAGSLLPVHSALQIARRVSKPCWVDLFGDPLAELHALQSREEAPDILRRDHVWRLTRNALLSGDVFSTVSSPQRSALLGQMLLTGRCGFDSSSMDRIHVIPCGVPPAWLVPTPPPPFPPCLMERGVKETTPFIYFGGTYNVWLDEISMGGALRQVLERNPESRFVCRGITTSPESLRVRDNMMARLESVMSRVVVLDDEPDALEDDFLPYASACLCLDRTVPEAVLGSRNRLLAMLRHGTRPVVTEYCELERDLVRANLADGVIPGDVEAAARALGNALRISPEERATLRTRSLEWLAALTFERTMQPVLGWIESGCEGWPCSDRAGLISAWADHPVEQSNEPRRKRWGLF